MRRLVSLVRNRLLFKLRGGNRSVSDRMRYLEEVVGFLQYETSHLSSLMRYAVVSKGRAGAQETRKSFDFQWDKLPAGRYTLKNESFRREAPDDVCRFTSLSAGWFKGKNVLDAGCGAGRYSWALCKLGAQVLSVDYSEHGIACAKEACKDFPGHRVLKADLLEGVPTEEIFDLVWSFGVLHHTGNTYRTFKNIVPLVKPGGYLFLMIYGEPRRGVTSDYAEVNEYDYWRMKTKNMSPDDKLWTITKAMNEGRLLAKGEKHIHGYFDAISPEINDLYSWEEIEGWLIAEGFQDIKRTIDGRNHHVVAIRTDR